MEFLYDSGLFATKAIIVVALFAAFIAFIVSLLMRQTGSPQPHEQLEITKINDRLDREKETLRYASIDEMLAMNEHKQKRNQEKAERKAQKKAIRKAPAKETLSEPPTEKSRVFVLDFDGDLQASAVSQMRRVLSAVLGVATKQDEIVLRLESGGGVVHSYGLAASQLERVKHHGVKLTVCVDKVAASGGYMMACVADQLLCAPFAVIGSIGVVAQLPNFNRLLKKHDIDFELLTAGEHKRTLTVFGENTDEGRQKFREDLEDIHALFKEYVVEQRPVLDIDEVATGEIWLGRRALDFKLVDAIKTSDEYLIEACERATVLEVKFVARKSLQEKLMSSFEMSLDRAVTRIWQRATTRQFL